MKKSWEIYGKGIVMGAADVVPGVSGGTMALILGIYKKLLTAIADIRPNKLITTVDWFFFVPLGLGIGTSILLLSHVIHTALSQYTGQTYAFFFGLIAVSGYILLKNLKDRTAYELLALTVGMITAYMFVGLNPIDGIHTGPVIFFSGAIAIMAMILPGVSGSFLLLLLGQYEYIVTAVKDMNLITLTTFALGCLLGLFAFAHILKRLLASHESITLAFLIGMIIGSLRLPIQQINASGISTLSSIGFAVLGFALVIIIEQLAARKQ